jgi:hypothetical protein
MIMVKLVQGCCGIRGMECFELPHSKVLDYFIRVNFGYDFLREVIANKTYWLDGRMAKWNLAGTCSNSGTIRKMSTMGSHKVERI